MPLFRHKREIINFLTFLFNSYVDKIHSQGGLFEDSIEE